ncbi:MAG: hypothetical protein ABIF85_05290 [Nanoarchaeota archaeon]|nr:hypothetical protein [Nanoarchaeota archaeon]MBU4452393.1 hypothetical protein [Nanoarchaeota archaeon]MCG2723331.1 hypothetical protein [archaeon]
MKIGVIGSAMSSDDTVLQKARCVGEEIALRGCYLLTGATTGIPYEAACGAKEKNGFVVGISPAANLQEHVKLHNMPTENHDILIFTGAGKKGRNVTFVRSCDAVILIAGRIGTLNEFTIAYDEGKVIGVLRGTGGISELIPEIIAKCAKKGGTVIYDDEPKRIVERVLKEMNEMKEMKEINEIGAGRQRSDAHSS